MGEEIVKESEDGQGWGLKVVLGWERKYCNFLFVLGPKLLSRLSLVTSEFLISSYLHSLYISVLVLNVPDTF